MPGSLLKTTQDRREIISTETRDTYKLRNRSPLERKKITRQSLESKLWSLDLQATKLPSSPAPDAKCKINSSTDRNKKKKRIKMTTQHKHKCCEMDSGHPRQVHRPATCGSLPLSWPPTLRTPRIPQFCNVSSQDIPNNGLCRSYANGKVSPHRQVNNLWPRYVRVCRSGSGTWLKALIQYPPPSCKLLLHGLYSLDDRATRLVNGDMSDKTESRVVIRFLHLQGRQSQD